MPRPTLTVALTAPLLLLAACGCASSTRLAATEDRVDILEAHVAALESMLLSDDADDAEGVYQVGLAAATRPTRTIARAGVVSR